MQSLDYMSCSHERVTCGRPHMAVAASRSASAFYIGLLLLVPAEVTMCPFQFWASRTANPTEALRGVAQALQLHAAITPHSFLKFFQFITYGHPHKHGFTVGARDSALQLTTNLDQV
jgi:hypothetical protein